jgi:hypothetical protein
MMDPLFATQKRAMESLGFYIRHGYVYTPKAHLCRAVIDTDERAKEVAP